MMTLGRYRWRKITDVNRKCALFEMLQGETPILDVGFTDEGKFEIAFNSSISGIIFDWVEFLTLLEEGRVLAELDQ